MRRARPDNPTHLRTQAEDHLQSGTAPATRGGHAGAPILGLLHGLAGAPASASDALKLLHELQVHQVELDLQQDQTDQAHRHLVEALATYTALFQLAPFGYLLLSASGELIEANQRGAAWLGLVSAEGQGNSGGNDPSWVGRRIHEFLSPGSQPVVQDVLLRLSQGGGRETFIVHAGSGEGLQSVATQGVATGLPGGGQILLAFMPVTGV